MKRLTVLCLFSLCLFAFSCDNSSAGNSNFSSAPREKTAQEIREELKQKEQENPSMYLISKGTYRKNFIDETVLEGTIKNIATIASFKDIVIEAEFFASSGTSLGSKQFTRYEILGSGYNVTFKFKTFAPKETQEVGIRVIGATPIY